MKKIFYMFGVMSLAACITTNNITTQTPLYQRNRQPYSATLENSCRVYHQDNQSKLALQISERDYDVVLSGYTGFEAKELLFSNKYQVRGNNPDTVQSILLPTNAPLFALEIDIYPKESVDAPFYSDVVWVNRLQDGDQSIYLVDAAGMPLLRKYVRVGETFRLGYRNDSMSQFSLNYFAQTASPAPAPHSSTSNPLFNPLKNYNKRIKLPIGKPIQLKEEGMYFIQSDSTSNKGAFLLCVDADYPKMARLNDLILSMRYITKNIEYDAMLQAADKKKELDNYWLNRNSDKEKARQQLKLYFSRIAAANRLFSAQTEGWKTDKGLLFIVFGVPDRVYKFSNKEVWKYFAHGTVPETDWLFNRTGEQYILERYEDLRVVWGEQIENWRKGIAK